MREYNFTKKRKSSSPFKKLNLTEKSEVYIKKKSPILLITIISVVLILVIYIGITVYINHKKLEAWNKGIELIKVAEELYTSREPTLQYRAILNYSSAIPLFEYCGNPYAPYYIALSRYRLGDREEAIKTMENLSIYAPTDIFYFTLANWYEPTDVVKAKYFYEN